ncbi:MAG: PKD domain-containing protein, partial [Bacteroidetes bacterium]|nr:PKD domain-containing protein [Bacteroidota bacterium]
FPCLLTKALKLFPDISNGIFLNTFFFTLFLRKGNGRGRTPNLFNLGLNFKPVFNDCLNNCFNFIKKEIIVSGPEANFSAVSTVCDTPSTINFTNNSVGNQLTYFWDFGDGAVDSVITSPSHTYTQFGVYLVTLIVTDLLGCKDTATQFVELLEYEAKFGLGISSVNCDTFSFEVAFTDSSSPNPQNWIWSFGDADSSNKKNPAHLYDTAGIYYVTLISSINSSCIDTFYDTIMYVEPKAKFTADSIVACGVPFTVNFSNNSTGMGPLSYKWKFTATDSSTLDSPSFTFNNPGQYFVFLYTTDIYGCADTTNQLIIIVVPNAYFETDTLRGCIPLGVPFVNKSDSFIDTVALFWWNFGDPASGPLDSSNAKNPYHIYSDTGTFSVTLIIETGLGCRDTIERVRYISTGTKPDSVDFFMLPNDTICHNKLLNFYDLSGFVDTATNINYWCWIMHYRSYMEIGVWPFLIEKLCADTGQNDPDALYATVQNPIHEYNEITLQTRDTFLYGDSMCYTYYTADLGHDTIRLIAGFNGCGDTIIKPIFINPPAAIPGILFLENAGTGVSGGVTGGCWGNGREYSCCALAACTTPATFGFFNGSVRSTALLYYYIIHEQTGDTLHNTTDLLDTTFITFTKAGTYKIKIAAENDTFACADARERTLTIDSVRNDFSVTPTDTCLDGNTFVFQDSSESYFGKILTISWDFGDGDVLQNYDVVMGAVVNIGLLTDTIMKPIKKTGITTGTYLRPVHNYSDTGTYIIKRQLRVLVPYYLLGKEIRSDMVCYYYYFDTIKINFVFPGFIVSDSTTCPGTFISFTDTSKTTSGIVSWVWDFGDGTGTSSTQHPFHLFTDTGSFDIKLIVTDMEGCTDSLIKQEFILITLPEPKFLAIPDTACKFDSIFFTNLSKGAGLTYLWDFGDSTQSLLSNPSHVYPSAGNYTVTLTATDSNGCDSTFILNNLYIGDNPVAGFEVDADSSDCPPLKVNFTDTSSGGIVSWLWDFGDMTTSNFKNPSHIYNASGSYTITLIVTDTIGCMDTVIMLSHIFVGGPTGTFTFGPDSGCIGLEVIFIATALNTDLYIWDLGNGDVQVTYDNAKGDTLRYTYTIPGAFSPILILQDTNGCQYTITTTLKVYIDEIHADFAASDTFFCDFDNVELTNLSTTHFPPKTWLWDFGDGDSSNTHSPVHEFDSAGTFNIVLKVISQMGCIDSANQTVIVNKRPDIMFNLVNDTACIPFTVELNADTNKLPSPVESWQWQINGGTILSGQHPTLKVDKSGEYTVDFSALYAQGQCRFDTTFYLLAAEAPLAIFNVLPLNETCLESDSFGFLNSSINANSYFWDFNDDSISSEYSPTHVFADSGNFYVKLIVSNFIGCKDSLTTELLAYNDMSDFRVPNVFTPLPASPGKNDLFYIHRLPDGAKLEIFTRWGTKVYESENYQNDWDAIDVEEGVYFFILSVCPNQTTTGFVHILRGN